MTQPSELHVLAEAGGCVVAEHGALVVVVDRGTGPWATLTFVLAVFALVVGGFGVVTLTMRATGDATFPWWLSAIFLLVGLVIAGAALAVMRRIRSSAARPVSSYRPVAIFDRARRVFVDGDGVMVAPLDQVRFDCRTQLTSSSPMLVVITPAGTRILKRGNPFNGGVGNLAAVLTSLVAPQPR